MRIGSAGASPSLSTHLCGRGRLPQTLRWPMIYLVDKALQLLDDSPADTVLRAPLHNTRGTALLQLSRLDEAAASFEISLEDRPDNLYCIESLIKCYEGREEKLADVYRDRLKELKAQKNDAETDKTK